MDYMKKNPKPPHPRESANIFSLLSFFYMLPVFVKGAKRSLDQNDLYEVPSTHKTSKLGDQLEKEWKRNRDKNKKTSIVKLVVACYGWDFFLIGICDLVVGTLFVVVQPYALSKVISYFNPDQTEMTKNDLYLHAALLIGLNLAKGVYQYNWYFWIKTVSYRMRAAFASLIYRKALRLSPESLKKSSIGQIVTLLGKDVLYIEFFSFIFSDIVISVVKTIIVCYVMYRKVDKAALAALGIFLVVLPVQVYMATWSARLRTRMCEKIDHRLQATQEALSSIKTIKMYAWEKHFRNKIMRARRKEIQSMHAIFYLRMAILQIGAIGGNIAFYLLIMTYKWLGNQVTAELLYYIDSCFQIFSYTMGILFPSSLSLIAEMGASVRRVTHFLELPEVPPACAFIPASKPLVFLKSVDVHLDNKELLHGVSLSVSGGLTIITGAVGSGKSVLLKTILGEYPISGERVVEGTVSYASQEPWLFPSTIQQNVLFGERYDHGRYHQVLKMCALDYDINLLPSKDMTIVEDRGINLSKGQQCRINLARAVYKNSDIYLLDDCLSSLDNTVADFIFKKCIRTFLQNKLVVFVSHNDRYLREVKSVVVVHGGTTSQSGSLDTTLLEEDRKVEEVPHHDAVPTRRVFEETLRKGTVSSEAYKKYLAFSGGGLVLAALLSMYVLGQFVSSYPDKLLSQWVNIEQQISNFTLHNVSEGVNETLHSRDNTLKIYTAMVLSNTFINVMAMFFFWRIIRRASVSLYKYMITNVISATMCFFDRTFIGNILNRFSDDFNNIDDNLPYFLNQTFYIALSIIATTILIATVNAYFLIPSFGFFGFLVVTRSFYLKTSRSLKRLDPSTLSPVIGYFNASIEGLSTIRVCQVENVLKKEFDQHQDLYISAIYLFQCSMKTFAFWLETFCNIFMIVIIGHFVFSDDKYLAGNVGLALSQALKMISILQWGVWMWAELENYMTSVERVLEYAEVAKESDEGALFLPRPLEGKITYDNVFLSYDATHHTLKSVSFIINPGEKVGVVGRTGAGKSSIISTLFRLYEPEGTILLDEVDTKTLSLSFLRKHIAIIPQDPVIFAGSVRENIDPEKNHSDAEIWKALETVNLKTNFSSLDDNISDSFSVGQRQLVCIARAVVRKNKIVVLDEVTASVDSVTDAHIQETIRRVFDGCTMIVVAHKLHSVLDLDKILVMENGKVIDWDSPESLLRRKNGYFYEMVQKLKM